LRSAASTTRPSPSAGHRLVGRVAPPKASRCSTPEGEPSELTKLVQQQLEQTEAEIQRTRLVGQRLQELDCCARCASTPRCPTAAANTVDGFLTVDEDKLKALPDATLVELQRTGLLGLVHAHLISLGNMRRLAEWRLQSLQKAQRA
jgi:hypothetical protein